MGTQNYSRPNSLLIFRILIDSNRIRSYAIENLFTRFVWSIWWFALMIIIIVHGSCLFVIVAELRYWSVRRVHDLPKPEYIRIVPSSRSTIRVRSRLSVGWRQHRIIFIFSSVFWRPRCVQCHVSDDIRRKRRPSECFDRLSGLLWLMRVSLGKMARRNSWPNTIQSMAYKSIRAGWIELTFDWKDHKNMFWTPRQITRQ
jgi:protein-S-isoprenylcysteine O-methyltransferase Ste14